MKKKTLLLLAITFLCTTSLTACGNRDAVDKDETSTHIHSYSNEWSKDASKHWHASTCGDDTKADEAEHSYCEWTVITDSTLTTKGEKVRTCSVCGYEDTEEIAKKEYYTISWLNYDDTVLETDTISKEGCMPSYDGSTPTKVLDDGYEYSFVGWDKEIGVVTSDVTYKAEYNKTLVFKYTTNKDNILTITKYNGTKNEVVVPSTIDGKTVTSIGSDAFSNCSSLTSVTIPDNVTSIGNSPFSGCSSLQYNEYDTGYYLGNENNPYVCFVKSKSKDISSCNINDNCKFIFSEAFSNCSSLTSVTIPDNVTSIGNSAFTSCSSLTSVTIRNGVTSIEYNTFYNCSRLTSITIGNSVTSIGYGAFSYCSRLTSVTIPNSVTSIGYSAFNNCSSLTSVTIPNSVTSIINSAFSNCSGLTSVTIPNSVTSIGDGAFSYCSSLTSVTIPDNVTSIGSSAFSNCSSLTSVTIGNGVTSIGDNAFAYCSSLNTVYFKGTIIEWNNINIYSFNTKLMEATKYFYSESEPTDTTYNYWHYIDGEPTAW